jgi:NTE family protein
MAETVDQSARALILGGGGMTGVAWEIGVLVGLHDQGVDVTDVGLIVGTSAGSVVGAQITSSLGLEELFARQLFPPEPTGEHVVQTDPNVLRAIFLAGAGATSAQEARARIGAAALAAPTISEQERVKHIAAYLPAEAWPSADAWPVKPQLVVTAVDAQSGEWLTFHRDSGVDLLHAVAASCAVPGLRPPATIGERRYIDGGMRSRTNADVAAGYQRVLILRVETTDWGGTIPHLTFEEELNKLHQAGGQVLVISPDEASVEARGSNPGNPNRRAASAQAGRKQGRQMADSVRRFWQK